MRLLIQPNKPVLSALYRSELRYLQQYHGDQIHHFFERARATKRLDMPSLSDRTIAWMSKPENLMELQELIDPDARHKSWKRFPKNTTGLLANTSTYQDLSIAYSVTVEQIVQLHRDLEVATVELDHLPMFVQSHTLDEMLAASIGRRSC